MKKESNLYSILKELEPGKVKRVKRGKCPLKQIDLLYGVHIVGVTKRGVKLRQAKDLPFF